MACAAVLAPVADAGSRPVYLFLRDMSFPSNPNLPRCSPAPTGAAVGDGELTTTAPCPLDLVGPQNNSSPQSRVVFPAVETAHPTQFVMLNQSLNTGQIFGPVLVLLYVPESPTVQSGNLTVQLVALPKTYTVSDVGPTGDVLAGATIDLAYHNTTLPNPTSLIPPDPTNVTQAEAYIAGQLLVYGLSQVGKSQYILVLDDEVKDHYVQKTIDKDAKLALRFSLVPSPHPAPLPLGLPVAQGAGQPILYNFALMPALVYVPFYSADAPLPQPTPQPNPPPPPPPGLPPCPECQPPGSSTTGGSQKSGAPEAVFVMTVLAVAALSLRRRT